MYETNKYKISLVCTRANIYKGLTKCAYEAKKSQNLIATHNEMLQRSHRQRCEPASN